jgi:hypothetical protein
MDPGLARLPLLSAPLSCCPMSRRDERRARCSEATNNIHGNDTWSNRNFESDRRILITKIILARLFTRRYC